MSLEETGVRFLPPRRRNLEEMAGEAYEGGQDLEAVEV